MCPGAGVNKLRSDPHPTPCLADRAFEDIADTEFTSDLLHIDRLALIRKTRIAGDNEEPPDAGERSSDFLDHPVGEIVLFGIAAHVLERQYCNRRLVGQRQWLG